LLVVSWARFRTNDLVFQLEFAGADRLVDHLPDLPIQLVLLPDAVRGPQQHRRNRDQPDRAADRRIDPLVTPQADAQLAISGVMTTVSA
jgi:hypothetical protein